MKLFPLNKALLWKEWRQNRWLFWIGFVVLSYGLILLPLLWLAEYLITPASLYLPDGLSSILDLTSVVVSGGSMLFSLGGWAAIVLGAVLLSQERGMTNTLDFLAATPIGRKDILRAKYVTGVLMIGLVLVVNLAFVLIMAWIVPSQYSGWSAIYCFLQKGLVLLAIYSISFAVSTLFGNLVSALGGAICCLFAPWILVHLMEKTVWRVLPGFHSFDGLNSFVNTTFLPYYLDRNFLHEPWWIGLIMLAIAVAMYGAATWLFHRNPFERNGRVLMFGRLYDLLQLAVPLLVALLVSTNAEDGVRGVVLFLVVFGAVYALFRIGRRVRTSWGFR